MSQSLVANRKSALRRNPHRVNSVQHARKIDDTLDNKPGCSHFWAMATKTVDTRLKKKAYEAQVARLREELIQLQVKLKESPFKILLIVAGVEGAGRSELINTLMGWLDPRGVEIFSYLDPTDEERERPLMWRFWRSLPTRGRIGIYASSWYTETIRQHAHEHGSFPDLFTELERIRHFERVLVDNRTLVIKIWLHMSRADQGARLRELASDERTAWRVTPEHWHHHRHYKRLERLSNRILSGTDQPGARWLKLDIPDERTRHVAVASLITQRFKQHHSAVMRSLRRKDIPETDPKPLRPTGLRQLRALQLDQKLDEDEYEEKRDKWLGRLNQSIRRARGQKRSVVFVFEGWDAAGKGGAIRRLTSAMDARDYRVVPIAKPTDEERSHHYLWRFWRQIPRAGQVVIFDRSWYGRVLVERLEGFARREEWRRAYNELNDFESELTEHGMIIVKFWLHVSKDEQLKRFRERESTPYKQHKINEEDWRNRAKWEAYEVAVGDMLALTNKLNAPWHLVPANNKRYARLEILRAACRQIDRALET
ncbi:MAG: polyphosphate:AMP phosphotransferase [Opitutaceae bacterium]|nr:polyphosphate:AMP phosphotransferase [Opitutaceae bacterium]